MNPVDFNGPQFLLFYILFTIVVLIVTGIVRRMLEGEDLSRAETSKLVSDPYAIAYLRGGELEALRIALLSLTDRGLIVHEDGVFRTAEGVELSHGRRPIERAILGLYVLSGDVEKLRTIANACEPYDAQLRRVRLLPDAVLRARRRWLKAFVAVLLGGLAFAKISIGIDRGRPVGFLIILGLFATLYGAHVASPRLTKHGEQFLESVKQLFARLRARASSIRPGGASADLALLAAAYGIQDVPQSVFPFIASFLPKRDTSASSSSGCGSSSSCGSSCGGGGCGGCGGGGD